MSFEGKLFIYKVSNLSMYNFLRYNFFIYESDVDVVSKKSLIIDDYKNSSPIFPSRIYIALSFILRL